MTFDGDYLSGELLPSHQGLMVNKYAAAMLRTQWRSNATIPIGDTMYEQSLHPLKDAMVKPLLAGK